jgi:hypothetical protein
MKKRPLIYKDAKGNYRYTGVGGFRKGNFAPRTTKNSKGQIVDSITKRVLSIDKLPKKLQPKLKLPSLRDKKGKFRSYTPSEKYIAVKNLAPKSLRKQLLEAILKKEPSKIIRVVIPLEGILRDEWLDGNYSSVIESVKNDALQEAGGGTIQSIHIIADTAFSEKRENERGRYEQRRNIGLDNQLWQTYTFELFELDDGDVSWVGGFAVYIAV